MIDVCLLLEGTYPYVAGGVSTWVHQLISSMRDIRFGIVYIAPYADPTRTLKYEIPGHVLYLKEIHLHDYDLAGRASARPKQRDYELMRGFYEGLAKGRMEGFAEFVRLFREGGPMDARRFFSSRAVWEGLTAFYDRYADGISFLDFFWTWRGTHLPLIKILQTEIPRARIYHSVSTGYAGLLGAVAGALGYGKFFLTEHGIYTHERMLEISQANWIYEREKPNYRASGELSFFKQWWVSMFRMMSRLAYRHADRIFTLYEGNKVRETVEGADPSKITVIPNGIDLNAAREAPREKRAGRHVGLVGRVVSIKDVKTFIQAAKIALAEVPDATFYVIGPTDEEEEYYEECRSLAEALGLEGRLVFTGRVKAQDYYRFLDLVVLTSLSEAQPYVILEANIHGIPVVATDVGACREMLEGVGAEDRALGPSGAVTEVANPSATARAMVSALSDPELYGRLSRSGRERVARYYDQDDLLSRYLNAYEQNL